MVGDDLAEADAVDGNLMKQRDPRIDPKAGDKLRLGTVTVRVLPCEVAGEVFYELNGKPCQIDKRGWIDWCAATDANVLWMAQQGGER